MQIDVLVLPVISNASLSEKSAVVIDVLRATSTIVTALGHKALEVIPVVETVEVADLIRKIDPQICLTGGERKGLKIEGFDLGNSPLEYTEERVKGKKVVFSTTNGTKAIKSTQGAAAVYIGSFLNVETIVDQLRENGRDSVLICSGRDQYLCLEDLACAGMMIELLQDGAGALNDTLTLTDAAKLAQYVWEKTAPNPIEFIGQTQHGSYLKKIGLEQDIRICLDFNKYPILPIYSNGKISL